MGRRVGHRRCRIVIGIKNTNMKNSLMIKWFTGRRLCQISQTILHGRDAILRVRDKLLISNIILQLWADVKYHVPTGFFIVKRRVVFILLARQKAVFYVFCFGAPQYLSAELCQPFLYNRPKEPSLWCVGGGGGNKKSLLWKEAFGDPGGARTLDPLIKSQLLYQLSYGVMMFIRFRIASAKLRQFLKPAKKICVFFKKSAFFVVFLVFSPSCASVLCVFGPKFG